MTNSYLKLERQEMCSQTISGVKVFLGEAPHTSPPRPPPDLPQTPPDPSPTLREGTPIPRPPQRLWRIASHLRYAQVLRKLPFGGYGLRTQKFEILGRTLLLQTLTSDNFLL